MEKDRSARLIAIVALVLAVTGVSIGFAVLSTNLTINPIEANVKADDKLFTVYFSTSDSSLAGGTVKPSLTPSEEDGFTGKDITIDTSSTTLTGIGGTFTRPGQTITYELHVINTSKLDGHLTSITFNKAGDSGVSFAKCTATNENQATQDEVARACNDLEVKVYVNGTKYEDSNPSISKNDIKANNGTQTLKVEITYKDSAIPVTGDFKADFGTIQLVYKTQDNAGE